MTSERAKDRENTAEVLSLQRFTALAAAGIARASKRATKDLQNDAMSILDTFARKGGFSTSEEARRYLNDYIEPKDRKVLIEAAQRLPEPQRSQELTRLSAPAYNWRITRKQAIDKAQRLATKRLNADLDSALKPVYKRTVEEAIKRGEYSVQKQVGAAFRFDMPNERGIEQVLRGAGVYDKVRLFSAQEMEVVKQIITDGMLSGRTADQVARSVAKATGKDLYKARRLARTTTAQASVDAKRKEFEKLGITEYEVRCTLDERTCPICKQYDGKRYTMGRGPMPTFHPNCRCGIRQVVPDDIRKTMTRAARDRNGKSIKVPYDMTYEEWAKEYGSERAQKTLPPAPKFKKLEETEKPKVEAKPKVKKVEPKTVEQVYSEVETHEDLKTTIKDRWGKDMTFESGFEELDLDLMKGVCKRIDTLVDAFPIIRNVLSIFEARADTRAYAWVRPESVKNRPNLGINTSWFKDKETVTKSYERDLEAGFHPKGTTVDDIMVHEMGHVIETQLVAKRYPGEDQAYTRARAMSKGEISKEILARAFKNYKATAKAKGETPMLKDEARRDISRYALTNTKETLAEALADWNANGDKAKPLSIEIVKELRKEIDGS